MDGERVVRPQSHRRQLSQSMSSTILVIAKEPLIQTLMCSLVDLSGHQASVPRDDETVAAAITRVRPQLVLLDCEHDASCEEEAYDAAASVRAQVLLFTPSRSRAEVADFAADRGLRSLALPIRLKDFSATLQTSLRS